MKCETRAKEIQLKFTRNTAGQCKSYLSIIFSSLLRHCMMLLKIDCTHCTRFGPTQEILRENKKAIKARLNWFGICTFTTGACHIQICKTCTATVHMYSSFISNGKTSYVKRDGVHNALYRKDFEGNPCFILAFIRPLLQVLHS